MRSRFADLTRRSRRLAADTRGGVAVILALSLPVLAGVSALALEYGSALRTKSENQRTSDIAAVAAAHAYKRTAAAGQDVKVAAAVTAAQAVAKLNGVSSGVTVNFDDPADAAFVDVVISERKPILLSRLLRPGDSVTINTVARVALGTSGGLKPCILALGDDNKESFTANGNAGTYNLTGCGIVSNSEIAANGQTLQAGCGAPSFKKPGTCTEESTRSDVPDPLAELTKWPVTGTDAAGLCDHVGSFPDDFLSSGSGSGGQGKGNGKSGGGGQAGSTLKPGVLCVTGFSGKFDSIASDPAGPGNTLVLRAGIDMRYSGAKRSLSVAPSTTGDFEGVAIYAPASEVVVSGNAGFAIDGFSCFGIIADSLTFNGNITLTAECAEDDPYFDAAAGARPVLVR